MPRYSFESDRGEGEFLNNLNSMPSPPTPQHQQPPPRQGQSHPPMSSYQRSPYEAPSNRPGMSGAHPDSSFNRLRQTRPIGDEPQNGGSRVPYAAAGAVPGFAARALADRAPPAYPPNPSTHRDADRRYWGGEMGYVPPQSNITPEQNARESGLNAMNGPHYPQQAHQSPRQGLHPAAYAAGYTGDRDSHSSVRGLNTAAVPMGETSPGYGIPSRSPSSYTAGAYSDDPYQGYAVPQDPHLGVVNPNEIDDGDDGIDYGHRRGPRTSMLSIGSSHRSGHNGAAAGVGAGAAVGGAAAGAGVVSALGGLVGRDARGRGQYDAVHANTGYQGGGGSTYDLGGSEAEKAWNAKANGANKSKKWKLLIIFGIGALVAVGIGLGVYLGVFRNANGTTASEAASGQSAADDTANNGDLDINSDEIKKLLNNKNLHKVFPGIDYTPINTQYPDCVHNPPSQNNVTRDVAVLSQLTNTIRLYGTDCNQTEMTIHALKQLKMDDTIKIWLGVWQDNNDTTNARQLSQMWDILDAYGADPFKGLIVANEILFREQMTITQLGTVLSDVRSNLTSKGMTLPVATSDLGDDWTAELAAQSDYVMSNIHPFFAGVPAVEAAAWTWTFWTGKTDSFGLDLSKNIIAETGWPSQGGMDCGSGSTSTDCPDKSVAGIDEMNRFMSDWVCQALTNGTQYFWFESFDEPWKISFNSDGKNWEDHWGLMDVNRNLKDGVTIPDCGGATVD